MSADPLDEALDALHVLGDPSRAWGYPPSRGMHTFAKAAAQRVRRLRDEPEPEECILETEGFSQEECGCPLCVEELYATAREGARPLRPALVAPSPAVEVIRIENGVVTLKVEGDRGERNLQVGDVLRSWWDRVDE